MRADELDFSGLLVAGLAFAVIAEALGLHFILGAFMAGLFFQRRTIDPDAYEALRERTATFTAGFLAPLFFASIGLHLDAAAVALMALITTLAVPIALQRILRE